MITLKDFVAQTLAEIVDALTEFADDKASTGASPNPAIRNLEGRTDLIVGELDSQNHRADLIMPVTFDVAVSAEDTEGKAASAGIKVFSIFNADGTLHSEATARVANRVQFTVPLKLPDTGTKGRPITYGNEYAVGFGPESNN